MKTILLIEDNQAIMENLCEFLELEGYKVLSAGNGKKGIELATEHLPDLIICDVLMPQMNGHDVLSTLLKTRSTNAIPFIFSTSLSEKLNIIESLNLGADDYITKPFELETLLNLIRNRIRNGKRQDEKVR